MAKKEQQAEPWERQKSESTKAFEAFQIYRDMGTNRSISKVAQQLSKSKPLLTRWSAAYGWVERVQAWDAEQDREARQAQIDEIKKMRKRHADLANAMLVKAAKALKSLPEDEIKAQDVSRMVDVASKLERISRGDVGDVVEEREGENIAPMVQFYMPNNGRDEEEEEEAE